MKAFISYSTADKKVAGSVKTVLNDIGVEAFLAHEDINVSQVWKERIIGELMDSEIFIPLLSDAFKQSEWAPQEIGLAVAQGDDTVLFIPLSVDMTIPFGFISHIQSIRIPDDGFTIDLFIEPMINKHPHEVIPGLIDRMANARSWRNAEAFMLPLVPHFDRFNVVEVSAFAEASINNGEIWSANECRSTYLPGFIEVHRSNMASEILNALEYQIAEQQWYSG